METLNKLDLLEKIVRAKVKLEEMKAKHGESCPVENDPESFAPCSCGASTANRKIDEVLKVLSFKK